MTTFPWERLDPERGDKFALCRFVATDNNAYEMWARFIPDNYMGFDREPLTGEYCIYRATDNRRNSSASEEIYRSPSIPAGSIEDVMTRAEQTFMRFDRPIRALSDDEWRNWNDIVDPHDVKNMTSDYMILGRKKGDKGHYGAYNTRNGKFGSMRWGRRFKPKDAKNIDLSELRKAYPDYDIELRQGSGTYFDLNRKPRRYRR